MTDRFLLFRSSSKPDQDNSTVTLNGRIVRSLLYAFFLIIVPLKTNAQKPSEIVELEKDRVPATVTHGDCFIKGGTIFTVTNSVIKNGSILVKGGKIAAIGANLTAPAGVPVIEAAGKFIMPGIIDAHSHSAVNGNVNEGSTSISAEVRIADILDPAAPSIFSKLASGFTSSLVLHGSANPIGGQSAIIKLKRNKPVEDLIIPDAPRVIKFALGENVKRSNRGSGDGPSRFPTTRMGVEAVYRHAFNEARAYMSQWDTYEKNKQGAPPRKDLRLEALADVLRRKIWVHCHSYRADEMLMMLNLSKEYGFKLATLQHALEAYKIAPEIAAAGVGVSTFSDSWAYKVEAYDSIPYSSALCTRAGVVVSVNTDTMGGVSALNLEAAKTMKYGGMSENEALRLITINPAIQLGIDKRTGSLETGKDADISIWDGHPFSVYSRCAMTLIEGEVYFQRRDAFNVDKLATIRNEVTPCTADHLSQPVPPSAHIYAIVGATVHPIIGPDITAGTVVIEDGKIKEVGKAVTVPHGAVTVRARGLHVYPGLINAGTNIGLTEIPSVNATVDTTEGGDFQPDLLALTAINPESEHFAVTRGNGVASAFTIPGGSLIGGQSAVINLAGWTPEEMRVKSPAGLMVAFPEPPQLGRMAAFLSPEDLKRREDEAKNRVKPLKDYFERAKRYAAARAADGSAFPIDLKLEAMIPYVTGKAPVILTVNSVAGIRDAVKFAEEISIKPILSGVREAWKVADYLAQKHIPLILTPPSLTGPSSDSPSKEYDPYDTNFAAPGILNRAGVKFCFQTGDPAMAKDLTIRTGVCGAYGLSPEAGLKALTADAADILGVGDKIGSLAAGRIANVIVTDGDPLEVTTSIHNLFIAGKPVPLESKHTRLYQKYLQRLPSKSKVTHARKDVEKKSN